MKRMIATLLVVMMVLGAMFSITASAAVTGYGFAAMPNMSDINWEIVGADESVDYAMLCAYNGEKDPTFDANYTAAKANGVHVGAYSIMQATTVEEAQLEAANLLRVLEGKQFEYPIYVQVTDVVKYSKMDKDTITAIVSAEMAVLEGTRCFAGVYIIKEFADAFMDMASLGSYTTWVSELFTDITNTDVAEPTYTGAYAMWEYAAGTVNGVNGEVGLSLAYMYGGFPNVMINANLNGYGTSSIVAPAAPVEPDQPDIPDEPIVPDEPQDPVTNTDTPSNTDVPTPTDVVLGDVNGDGKIDAKDALQVLKYSVKKVEFTQEQKLAAEVDGKEGIDAKDALQILKYSVKKIEKFPIEA